MSLRVHFWRGDKGALSLWTERCPRTSHGTRGCVNCQRCGVKCTWCCHGAVGAKDESDDDNGWVYVHVLALEVSILVLVLDSWVVVLVLALEVSILVLVVGQN